MITCIGGLLAVIIYSNFFTDTRRGIIPYRFYNVLTNSMEPKIGTDSLVLVKVYDKSMKIKKNDIITFSANRFGEKIIITHRFSHTERNKEGETVYKTHPERTNTLDVYEMILSILVDTFFSRISLSMPPIPKSHNTACVLS